MKRAGLILLLLGASGGTARASLTLEQALALARSKSPRLAGAAAVREAARVEASRDRPVAAPLAELRGAAGVQGPRLAFPGAASVAPIVPEAFGRLSLSVEQLVYRAGGRAALARYNARLASADIEYRQKSGELERDIRRAWADAARARAGMETAEEGDRAARSAEDLARVRVAAGAARPVDVQSAAAQTAESASGIRDAASAFASARSNVFRLIGLPLDYPDDLVLESPSATLPAAISEAIRAAADRRPELALLDQGLAQARAGAELARTESSPTISVRGEATEQTRTALNRDQYLAATVELRWPLLDGGKSAIDARAARAEVSRLEALRAETRSGIELEVRQAWEDRARALDHLALAHTRREASEALLRVALEAYRVGRGTLPELDLARHDAISARIRESQSRTDIELADIALQAASGAFVPSQIRVALPAARMRPH